MEALGLAGISKDQVSRLCRALDERVAAFRERPLEGTYPYLWLDAKVRHEALPDRVRWKTAPSGCRSSPVKPRAA